MQFHAIYTTVPPAIPHYIRSFNIDLKRPIVLARWPNIELLRLFSSSRNNVLTYFSNDQRSGPPKAEGILEEIFAAFQ